METWLVWVIIAVAIVADLTIGIKFAAPRYVKRLDELEKKLLRDRPGEKLEFPFWKELGWNLAVFVFWWAVFPYEWRTGWRQWTYPYCLSGGAPKDWDKKPKISPEFSGDEVTKTGTWLTQGRIPLGP